ncbi:MAG: LysM peptidoglycan-binding domain-containing protein [Deltaproteobacteria bacterium]|nr:LysM peptidoglycan-binding domain-containing protein [Deltaproteobacteria bacterium]
MTEGDAGKPRDDLRFGKVRMRRFTLPVALLLLALLPSQLQAMEDNARLVFQKTAGSGQTRVHVVKPGEWIHDILRSQFGEQVVPYALIRQLNPDIKNLDMIVPGQKIVLPVPDGTEPAAPTPAAGSEDPSAAVTYRIVEGDSISRIILSEMNLRPSEALPAYRVIRKLNPAITDMNQLPVGGTLRLPASAAHPGVPTPAPAPAVADLPPAESSGSGQAAFADSLLRIIRPVITRMQGAVTLSGSHYVPIDETTQITIDCAQIPVVEMDDGTTVLLDYGSHLSENLKGLIRQIWKNYAFLTAKELRGELGGLPVIIGHSRNYTMRRVEKSLELISTPQILLTPDWVIQSKESSRGAAYRQGLFLLDPGERPLPAEVRAWIEKSGVAVTEIAGGNVVTSAETASMAQPAVMDLREFKGIALVERLLTILGERPERNAEVAVFDQARSGFNLSVTADLMVRKGEKRFIVLAKSLPDQFNRLLKEADTEVLQIGEQEQGRSLVEGTLRWLGTPVSFGHFSFRIPYEGKRARLTGAFSTLRVTIEGEPAYLIGFDIPSAVLPFLNGSRGGRIVRY